MKQKKPNKSFLRKSGIVKMATTYTKTVNGLTYTIVDNGPIVLGTLGHSYTASIIDSGGNSILQSTDINTGVLGTGLLGSGGVVTGSDGYTELLGLLGGTFVTLPGSTGDISIVVSLLNGNTFWIGGDTTITTLVSALSGQTINVYGGDASFSGNVIASALAGSTVNIGYGGKFAGSYGLINLITGSTINFTTGGGTLVVNAGGTLIDLSSTSINNYNPNLDTIEFQNTIAPVSKYTINTTTSDGSSVSKVTLYGANNQEIGTYTAKLASGVTLASGTYYTDGSTSNPLIISYDSTNTYVGACFLAGSMIRTTNGEVAVEDISIGDEVMVYDWRNKTDIVRPVVWVSKTHVNVRHSLPDDEAGWPVRILKNAVADGVPYKDMLITAEHCLFFKDSFVPVRMLVNGVSIFYDKSISSYDYYHVETEQHSVITADGMLTESYLDTGNRSSFRQEGKIATLLGAVKSWAEDAGAPLNVARPFVEPLYRSLEWRETWLGNSISGDHASAPKPELTSDPDLHLVTETGAIIRPMRQNAQNYNFMLPPETKSVRIVSRARAFSVLIESLGIPKMV
ncbi:Hint domain-containing protein, partial [Acetobacter cibinongensis]|uniref:Hint domain-containing protein n=1 Tax=Acetobacter cibinongensis TaxID=146475 RepID=UPI001F0B2887